MSIISRLVRVFRSLAGRGPVDRDLDAELTSSIEMLVDEKIARGLPPHEARRQALLELGGVEQVKEEVRAGRPAAWLDTLARDVRYGLRMLRKTPAFSLTAVLILALGVAANTAVFGLLNVLLFQSRPGVQHGQLAGIHSQARTAPGTYRRFSFVEYQTLRDHGRVFAGVMAFQRLHAGLADGENTRRALVEAATGNYFSTLGVGTVLGRTFTRDEERPGSAAAVAVISHRYWQKLGGRDDVLGQRVTLNGRPFTVVGVAPSGFTGTTIFSGPEVWVPLGAGPLISPVAAPVIQHERARALLVVARLEPDVSLVAANAALASLTTEDGEDAHNQVLTASALARTETVSSPADDAGLYAPMATLMGLALIVLVIASLNVANMQLARGLSRRKELVMRLALGAGRGRVVRQLLTEGLLLSLVAGAIGLALSVWVLHVLAASLSRVIDQSVGADLMPDATVLLATVAFCTLAAIVSALVPAWRACRLDLLSDIKGSHPGAAAAVSSLGPRHLLVAGQIALSLALLASAGLFVRGAVQAANANPGYDLDRQIVARVDASAAGYDERRGRQAFERVIERLRATPGVESATLASVVAFGNESEQRGVRRGAATSRDAAADAAVEANNVQVYTVGAQYFRTLALPLVRGREFTATEAESPAARPVAVIDEPLAARLFPGQDPIGQHVQFRPTRSEPSPTAFEIVGVVPGLRHRLTDRGPIPHLYLPLGSAYHASVFVHARIAATGTADRDMLATLRGVVREADASLAILGVSTLADARDAAPLTWMVRTSGQVFGAFGLVALGMAVAGLYGVKAYLVARRTPEIGIRMALGAKPQHVIGMILREGALLLGGGLALGILLAVAAGQIVGSLLVGVRPFDPLVLAAATLFLALSVLMACYLPARRATRVSPTAALRAE